MRFLFPALAWSFILLSIVSAQPASWQPRTHDLQSPNGEVRAVERFEDRLLLGGRFTAWGPYSGASAVLDPVTGAPLPRFPLFNNLNAVISDGAGGWIVVDGGYIETLPEAARDVRLLHLRGDGAIVRNMRIALRHRLGNNPLGIAAMTTSISGDTVYLGGSFDSIQGAPRRNAAAIRLSTGEVLPWNPRVNTLVNSLIRFRDVIIMSGGFDTIGTSYAPRLVKVDLGNGNLRPWQTRLPERILTSRFLAFTRLVLFNGALYTVGGAIDVESGEELPWHPRPYWANQLPTSFGITDLGIIDGVIYVVGEFTLMNDSIRNGVAAFDAITGQLLPWNPNKEWTPEGFDVIPGIRSLGVVGRSTYLSGSFQRFGSIKADGLVAVDTDTEGLSSWRPPNLPWWLPYGRNTTILYADDRAVFVQGYYGSCGREFASRIGFAEMDVQSGAVMPWDPGFASITRDTTSPDGSGIDGIEPVVRLYAFARNGPTLYVGGLFDSVGGRYRGRLCAFDLHTRALLPWGPAVAGRDVRKLVYADGVIYASGHFSAVGGASRRWLAAIDAATGEVLPWNPNPDTAVNDMIVRDGRVYLGGDFTTIGGKSRNGFAVVDATTGAVLDEGPMPPSRGWVASIEVSDSLVYLHGGRLGKEVTPLMNPLGGGSSFGGYGRVTGELRWVPKFEFPTAVYVSDMQERGGRLSVIGLYQTRMPNASMSRTGMTIFDALTGNSLEQGPEEADGKFLINGDEMVVYGDFREVEGLRMPYFARLTRGPVTAVEPAFEPAFEVERSNAGIRIMPNPASSTVIIEYLGDDVEGMISTARIFDSRGVEVARAEGASGHRRIELSDLADGVYFVTWGSHTTPLIIVR